MTNKNNPDSSQLFSAPGIEFVQDEQNYSETYETLLSRKMEVAILRCCINLTDSGRSPSASNVRKELEPFVTGLRSERRIQEVTRKFRSRDIEAEKDQDRVIDLLSPNHTIDPEILAMIAKMDVDRYPTNEYPNFVMQRWTKRQISIVSRIKNLLTPLYSSQTDLNRGPVPGSQILKAIIYEMSMRERIEEIAKFQLPYQDIYRFFTSPYDGPDPNIEMSEHLAKEYQLTDLEMPYSMMGFMRYSLSDPISNQVAMDLIDCVERFAVHINNYVQSDFWNRGCIFGFNDGIPGALKIRKGVSPEQLEMAIDSANHLTEGYLRSAANEYSRGFVLISRLRRLETSPNVFNHNSNYGEKAESTSRWAEDFLDGIWRSIGRNQPRWVERFYRDGLEDGRGFRDFRNPIEEMSQIYTPLSYEDPANEFSYDNFPYSQEEVSRAVDYIVEQGGAFALSRNEVHEGMNVGQWVYELAREVQYTSDDNLYGTIRYEYETEEEEYRDKELFQRVDDWEEFLAGPIQDMR